MPRILPRLRRALERLTDSPPKPKPATPVPSRTRPLSGRRRSIEDAVASSSIAGRTQSLILDRPNVVQQKGLYTFRRASTPKAYGPGLVESQVDPARLAMPEKPRRMTEEERQWYSNPYLRMVASPMRRCHMTNALLPRDFVLKFTPVHIPRSKELMLLLVPEGLEHPRFKPRYGRLTYHVSCSKSTVQEYGRRQTWKKITAKVVFEPEMFEQHIDHLLRVRVLQELELLALRLQARPHRSDEIPVVRRLTRAEWKQIKETGVIPFENAAAVLVVPPVNKNPATKQRPEPSTSAEPIEEDKREVPDKPLPPVATMHVTSPTPPIDALVKSEQFLPPAKVPLYNGISAFPSRRQRAALHKALNDVLAVERRARWRETGRPDTKSASESNGESVETKDKWARGDQKASHAYIIFSDAKTMLRADTVPLATALWRIRLWEGDGWERKARKLRAGGWKIMKPTRLPG